VAQPVIDLHDAIWAAVPSSDAAPEELALRLSYLLAHASRGETVLDVGCGAGAFSAALTKAGAEVIAVDVAAEALRRARARAGARRAPVGPRRAAAGRRQRRRRRLGR